MLTKKRGFAVALFVALMFCASVASAATIEFAMGDLTLGERVFMFKLIDAPYDSNNVVDEVKPGVWTYSKSPTTYQVYDMMGAITGVETPIVGDFLALVFTPEFNVVNSPFSEDNFVFGGYETDQYYEMDIDYTYNADTMTGRYVFSSVPIPSTLLLLGGGLVGLIGLKRKRA